jgi:hypothetical protein
VASAGREPGSSQNQSFANRGDSVDYRWSDGDSGFSKEQSRSSEGSYLYG